MSCEHPHLSVSAAYRAGCRCERCRRWRRGAATGERARKRLRRDGVCVAPENVGGVTGYRRYRCRCDRCVSDYRAERDRYRREGAKKAPGSSRSFIPGDVVRPHVERWLGLLAAEHGFEHTHGTPGVELLAKRTGVPSRSFFRLMREGQRYVTVGTVDKLFTGMNEVHLLHTPIEEGGLAEHYFDEVGIRAEALRLRERVQRALWEVPPSAENERLVEAGERALLELAKLASGPQEKAA